MKNSGDGGICGLYFKRLGAGYGALQYFVFELKRALQYSHLNMKYALSLSILDTNLVSIFDSTIYFRYLSDFPFSHNSL